MELPIASRFAGDLILLATQTQLEGGSVYNSLAPQRSAGRGSGREDFKLKISSPRPSPPASLGGEGVVNRFRLLKAHGLPVNRTNGARSGLHRKCSISNRQSAIHQ
jgi:hypothetical protein